MSDIIDKYSVYSMECANEMSKVITSYTNSNYGVGITGKLNDAIFSENNDIKYERTEYKYIFNKILFTLYFDYYSSDSKNYSFGYCLFVNYSYSDFQEEYSFDYYKFVGYSCYNNSY